MIRLSPQGARWAPMLTRIVEGRYCFRLTPLPADSGSALTFALDWDRGLEPDGLAPVPRLTPGLFESRKGSPSPGGACQLDSDASPAWVLVTADADFARVDADWKNALKAVNELDRSGASVQMVTTARRALLAALADAAPK